MHFLARRRRTMSKQHRSAARSRQQAAELYEKIKQPPLSGNAVDLSDPFSSQQHWERTETGRRSGLSVPHPELKLRDGAPAVLKSTALPLSGGQSAETRAVLPVHCAGPLSCGPHVQRFSVAGVAPARGRCTRCGSRRDRWDGGSARRVCHAPRGSAWVWASVPSRVAQARGPLDHVFGVDGGFGQDAGNGSGACLRVPGHGSTASVSAAFP